MARAARLRISPRPELPRGRPEREVATGIARPAPGASPSTTATLRERVSRYLSPPLFPVGLSEAPAEAIFEDVPREPWRIGSAIIEAQTVEHRGPTLGYRIEGGGRVLTYLPDHEPYLTAALDDKPEWISGWALAAGGRPPPHDSHC